MSESQIEIREPRAGDLNFIMASFLKSMRRESSLGRSCSTRVFYAEFHQVIDYLLANSKTLVACVANDPDVIIGYLIYQEPDTIHYALVKEVFQNMGVARALITQAMPNAKSFYFTQNTQDAKAVATKHPELIFNPFILYKKGA